MVNFLKTVVLAPMDDITDSPFRRICKSLGADIVFSEFVSSEGLIRDSRKSREKLQFHPEERPIGLQIYGHDPESISQAAKIATEYSPDFIDINAGCPVKKLVNKGSCAALLKDLPLLKKIIRKVIAATPLPVSVKMRLGWDKNTIVIPEAIKMMEDEGVKAVSIHARTRDQLYKGLADWDWIKKAVESVSIPIIGNGDIRTPVDAAAKFQQIPKLAGVMIGRGALGNPWIFQAIKEYLTLGKLRPTPPISIEERFHIIKKHLSYSVQERGERLGVILMRKHLSGYFRGLPHASKLRSQVMLCYEEKDIIDILDNYKKHQLIKQ